MSAPCNTGRWGDTVLETQLYTNLGLHPGQICYIPLRYLCILFRPSFSKQLVQSLSPKVSSVWRLCQDWGSPHKSESLSVHAACLKGVRESQQRLRGVWMGWAERDLSTIYFLSSGIKAVLQGNSHDTFFSQYWYCLWKERTELLGVRRMIKYIQILSSWK